MVKKSKNVWEFNKYSSALKKSKSLIAQGYDAVMSQTAKGKMKVKKIKKK